MISPVGLGDRAVFAQRYDQAGNALGAPVQVNDEPVGIAWPRVVADMQGSFLMAWRQSAPNTALGDITFRRLDAAGMLGTPVRVNPEEFAAAESAPAIAADRSGGFVIAGWYFSTGAIGLFASRYDSAGETPGPAALTDAWLWFGGSAPVLATDPYGGFVIVFSLQEYPASEAPPGALSTRAATMPRERRLERTCE